MFLEYDYDTSLWLEIPEFDRFCRWKDPRVWADQMARDVLESFGMKPRRGELDYLSRALTVLAEGRLADDTPRAAHFIYIPRPEAIPHRVRAWIGHYPDATLRDWVLADDPEAIDPPILEEFLSPRLGKGLRAFRARTYIPDPGEPAEPGEIWAVLRYAFPVDGESTAVVVTAATTDPAHLLKAMPDIDDLARNLFVVDRDGNAIHPVP
jgi:hypothetical protein